MEEFYHLGIKEIFLPFRLKGSVLDDCSLPKLLNKGYELLNQQPFINLYSSTLPNFRQLFFGHQ